MSRSECINGNKEAFITLYSEYNNSTDWRTNTSVCNVPGGCIMKVSSRKLNLSGQCALAEALTYVPGAHIDNSVDLPQVVLSKF